MANTVPCTVSIPTSFPEVYPNRIPEDIYDSSAGDTMDVWNSTGPLGVWNSVYDTWGTTGFIYVPYGPNLSI